MISQEHLYLALEVLHHTEEHNSKLYKLASQTLGKFAHNAYPNLPIEEITSYANGILAEHIVTRMIEDGILDSNLEDGDEMLELTDYGKKLLEELGDE
jgi:hypothetical protein